MLIIKLWLAQLRDTFLADVEGMSLNPRTLCHGCHWLWTQSQSMKTHPRKCTPWWCFPFPAANVGTGISTWFFLQNIPRCLVFHKRGLPFHQIIWSHDRATIIFYISLAFWILNNYMPMIMDPYWFHLVRSSPKERCHHMAAFLLDLFFLWLGSCYIWPHRLLRFLKCSSNCLTPLKYKFCPGLIADYEEICKSIMQSSHSIRCSRFLFRLVYPD